MVRGSGCLRPLIVLASLHTHRDTHTLTGASRLTAHGRFHIVNKRNFGISGPNSSGVVVCPNQSLVTTDDRLRATAQTRSVGRKLLALTRYRVRSAEPTARLYPVPVSEGKRKGRLRRLESARQSESPTTSFLETCQNHCKRKLVAFGYPNGRDQKGSNCWPAPPLPKAGSVPSSLVADTGA